jgi:predicted dehydrogenase
MNGPTPGASWGADAIGMDRRAFLAAAGGLAAVALMPASVARGAIVTRSGAAVRVAIIGAGRQGRAVATELAKIEACSVVAMCDVDERRLTTALRRTSGAKGYASVGALLGDAGTFDAAVVATPTQTHRAVAEAVLAAKKHCYVECPLAASVEDCEAIAAAARGAGVVAAAGLEGRSNPVYQLARGFFKSDSVRDLVSMHARCHEKTSWRVPSNDAAREKELNWRLDPAVSLGLPGEWGVHQFDVAHWYLDRYPVRVSGRGAVRVHKDGREVADTVSCELEFADGAVLQYHATLGNSYEGRHELFCGSNAAIKLAWSHGWMFKEADAPTQGWEVYANRQQFHTDEGITLIAGATKLAEQGKLKEGVGLPHPPGYYSLWDWVNAAAGNGKVGCTIDEAARSTRVAIAAAQAVRGRTAVDVSLE